jgi:hypothetical protein
MPAIRSNPSAFNRVSQRDMAFSRKNSDLEISRTPNPFEI